ncbi:MAG: hypothetical protein IT430_03745 [Phycisphaerales bacterium]|nr:hypothetical protein [Phycisphaerales bacterium]
MTIDPRLGLAESLIALDRAEEAVRQLDWFFNDRRSPTSIPASARAAATRLMLRAWERRNALAPEDEQVQRSVNEWAGRVQALPAGRP